MKARTKQKEAIDAGALEEHVRQLGGVIGDRKGGWTVHLSLANHARYLGLGIIADHDGMLCKATHARQGCAEEVRRRLSKHLSSFLGAVFQCGKLSKSSTGSFLIYHMQRIIHVRERCFENWLAGCTGTASLVFSWMIVFAPRVFCIES